MIDLPLELNSEMGICLGLCGDHLRVSRITGGNLNQTLAVWKLQDYSNAKWQLEYEISLKKVVADHQYLHNFEYMTAEVLAFHPTEPEILYLRLDHQIMKYDVGRTTQMVSECLGDSTFSIGTQGASLLAITNSSTSPNLGLSS